jgi:hypothetical protein
MAIWISAITLIFLSSITFVPSLLESIPDKSGLDYLLLSTFFNPVFDGITLVISILIVLFSHKNTE